MQKILLVRNDNIGDLINTTPAIAALRKKFPKSQIDIVVNTENYCAIHGNPNINHCFIYTKTKHVKGFLKKSKALLYKFSLLRKIKKTHYDLAILFRFDYSKNALCWMKAKRTIGVQNPQGKTFFTDIIFSNPQQPEVLFCFDLLAPLGIFYQNEQTQFFLPKQSEPLGLPYQDFLGIHLSSRLEKNSYPEKYFLEILKNIPSKNIILTAAPNDFAMAKRLAESTGVTFVPTKSFLEAVAVFAHCSLVLTLDGGMAHAAAALGIKTITLMNQDKISRWVPWGMQEWVISSLSGHCKDIPPEKVTTQINQLKNTNTNTNTNKTKKNYKTGSLL